MSTPELQREAFEREAVQREAFQREAFQRDAPPAGEDIHLPGPSLIPFVNAIGITFMVIGTTLGWWLSILGLIIFVGTAIRWIRDTRRDIDELPESHHGPGHGH